MSKKILMSVAPLVVVVAFAVMPALAQANTRSYGVCVAKVGEPAKTPCKANEVFEPFAEPTRILVYSEKATGTGNFVLENEAKTADIECSTLSDAGFLWNEPGDIGRSHLILVFDGCKGSGLLKECSINPLSNHEIEGVVTDEVLAGGEKVKVTIESGFNVKCGTTELGSVTGSVEGSQAEGSAVLKFANAKGLTFAGEPSTITGSDETFKANTTKPVYIN